MVTTRRGAASKNNPHRRTSKTTAVNSTTRIKRKAAQNTIAKDDRVARTKKRAKKEPHHYLQRSHDLEKDPNRKIGFLNLPRDIFDEMKSWLEPDTLTCLSLTCKEILGIVGTQPWRECRAKRMFYNQFNHSWTTCFRESLVPLLQRDSPHLTHCVACMTLHPSLKPPREHKETKLTRSCYGPWSLIDYLPRGEAVGYSLLWEHILEARKLLVQNPQSKIGPPIELLDGNFTTDHERLEYKLNSSGRQIGKNLILKHQHIFRGTKIRSPLRAADIMALPVRICPHQTTSTEKPAPGRYTKSRPPSGLLSHCIATAAPTLFQTGFPLASNFSPTTPSEKKQMESGNTLWVCRACPTKWRVQYSKEEVGELRITVWHSFGDTANRAQEYWKMLVRREASNMAAEKRNSEFFISTKQYVDFSVDQD